MNETIKSHEKMLMKVQCLIHPAGPSYAHILRKALSMLYKIHSLPLSLYVTLFNSFLVFLKRILSTLDVEQLLEDVGLLGKTVLVMSGHDNEYKAATVPETPIDSCPLSPTSEVASPPAPTPAPPPPPPGQQTLGNAVILKEMSPSSNLNHMLFFL